MFFEYKKIIKSYEVRHLCPSFQYFIRFWVQTDMNQHKSKEKNVFFRKETHSKCMRDVLHGPKKLFLLCCCFKKEKTGY